MSQALLVLGAGALHVPLLRWAREACLTTVVAESDPRARGRRLADQFHSIPAEDVHAHAALAQRLAREGSLCGLHASAEYGWKLVAQCAPFLAARAPTQGAFERALDRKQARAIWREHGFPLANDSAGATPERHDVTGFFRDGVFVPAGIADRGPFARAGGDAEWSVQPTRLQQGEARAAYALAERAARALEIHAGPITATLAALHARSSSPRELALVELQPGFRDLVGASHVAPLVYGRSPIQAWFGALAGAGGPFDELALEPRCSAGWMSIQPERAGRLAVVEGVSRARAVPGFGDLLLEEPGRELAAAEACGYLWAQAADRSELEERLRAARAALEVRSACRQAV